VEGKTIERRTSHVLLLRCRFFRASCLLDIDHQFMFCLVLVDGSRWIVYFVVNIETSSARGVTRAAATEPTGFQRKTK